MVLPGRGPLAGGPASVRKDHATVDERVERCAACGKELIAGRFRTAEGVYCLACWDSRQSRKEGEGEGNQERPTQK